MKKTITKKNLTTAVAVAMDIPQVRAAAAVQAVFGEIQKVLEAGDTVDIAGFGRFEVKELPARSGIHPRTKEPMEIPACRTVRFKAGSTLKKAVK